MATGSAADAVSADVVSQCKDFQCLCLQNIQPSTSQMHKACHPSPQIVLFFSPEPLFVIRSVISQKAALYCTTKAKHCNNASTGNEKI